jgi:hypothetical protein
MPLTGNTLPFGLRDVRLSPLLTTGLPDTANKADLPVARTFSFKETEDFETLEGDDSTAGSHGSGPTVEWELEAGGISFEVWKILAGGTITQTGTTPAQKATFSKLVTDARPYFQVEGQAISDSGGDVHCIVYRCKADGDLEMSFENGSFTLTAASGHGFGDTVGTAPTGKLYDFVRNETTTAIP